MWVWLGLCLRIPLADLQKIQQERGQEGVKACLAAMLEKWTVEKEESPLWQEVVAALCQIGHAFLATCIAKKYSEHCLSVADNNTLSSYCCHVQVHSSLSINLSNALTSQL